MREILNAIQGNAVCFPDRLAIVTPDAKITYGDLWKKVSIAWTKIEELGLDRDKPVILLIDNPLRHTIVRLALICAGYCVAPIRIEHASLVRQLNPEAFFSDNFHFKAENVKNVTIDDQWLSGDHRPIEYHHNLRPTRVGTIVFTSGSTGIPKPIALTFLAIEDAIKTGSLFRFPLQRVFMAYGLSTHGSAYLPRLLVEASTIYFSPQKEVIDFLKKQPIQEIICSPTQMQEIMNSLVTRGINIKIDRVTLMSAPISQEFGAKIIDFFRCQLYRIYNAQEVMQIAVATGDFFSKRKHKANAFFPTAIVQIVDDEGTPLPSGAIGRVKICSNRVSHLYDGRMEIVDPISETPSFVSNDLGKLEPDGVLVLIGRADETINFGGAKFAPEIPEEIFRKHPLIVDAGVVAVRSEDSDQQAWLALVAPKGIDVNSLNQWYAQSTSGEMRSMRFDQCFLVDQIPRGLNGKVLRRQLRDKLLAIREGINKV